MGSSIGPPAYLFECTRWFRQFRDERKHRPSGVIQSDVSGPNTEPGEVFPGNGHQVGFNIPKVGVSHDGLNLEFSE